ncbi:dnaJ homolog subfamily C member 27-like [Dysidea avara]|uniref:dnaJ homolog subfamily C member 27-like n=1 Tax=Dysidea avara TaxID=196820 RepID=UPI003332F958
MTENKLSTVIRIKVITLGAAECGKSCLIKRYCEKRFISKYMATIGIDYGVAKVMLDDYEVRVDVFDMAGQPFFYDVRNEFYKDVNGAIVVYDVTNQTSFNALDDWITEFRKHMPNPQDIGTIPCVVCANKVDLDKQRVIYQEGKKWAETRGFSYFETSCCSGQNVNEMFRALVTQAVDIVARNGKAQNDPSQLGYTYEQIEAVRVIKNTMDNYEMLGIKRGSSKDDVIKAYKQYAILVHPDKNLAPGSDEAFKKLTKAKDDILGTMR